MGYAIGPDVSFYQDEPETPEQINFVKMKKSADFVIIRAGQNLWTDSDFKYNWTEAKKAGLPRGTYWFYDSRADPKRQAELWVDLMDGDFGELPLFADFEEAYGGAHKGWRKWFDFLERLKELVGQKEIAIYTAFYYWRDNAPNPTTQKDSLEYFHQYPLWIANYGVSEPALPKPWGANEWLFWQFTETGDGKLYGVESKGIDLNYFNGDAQAFRQRFGIEESGPTPPAEGDKYQVELNIRQTPEPKGMMVGTLKQGEIVEKLDVSTDENWMQIRRADGTTGWIVRDYLILQESTPPAEPPVEPPVEPPPGGDTTKWYKVTSTALNVRGGPSTSYDKVGVLKQGDVVKALDYAAVNSWVKIYRESDGLTGWCYASYLELTGAPTSPGNPPVEPPPAIPAKHWYQVKSTTLNVRESPSTSGNKVGVLKQGEMLIALEETADGSWVRAQRFDGLAGWCATSYLNDLGATAPEKLTQKIFPGVTYFRKEMQSPRRMVAHVLAIDTQTQGLKGLVTPPSHTSGLICTRKTSKFVEEFGLQVAVNGDGFKYLSPDEYDPEQFCPNGGEPVKVNSYAASRGAVYSERWVGRPIMYINKNNVVSFNEPSGAIYNAVSGDRMLVEKGKVVPNLESQSVEPRTAAGTNQNGRWLFLVVIDGRQPGYSDGATFPELANFLLTLGVYTGLNLDGGGSSAMVIEGALGGPFVLNSPIEGMIPGNESAVSNHLGFWVNK